MHTSTRTRRISTAVTAATLALTVGALTQSPQPAAAATAACGPTRLQVKVLGFTPLNLDDSDGDDEVHLIGEAIATNKAVGANLTPTIKVHQNERITLPASMQTLFDNQVGPSDNVHVHVQGWDVDTNYLNVIPPAVRSQIESQLKSAVLSGGDASIPALVAYLGILGYNYLAQPDLVIDSSYDFPACGPAQQFFEGTNKFHDVHWNGISFGTRQYTTYFEVDRTSLVTCQGKTPTIFGTDGDDTITGTPGADIIAGLAGNDTIDGLGGDDVICGGLGNDRLTGSDGNDTLIGDDGDDILAGNAGNDRLEGGAGSDSLQGGKDNDLLFGSTGDDTLIGGLGADILYGETGYDTLFHSNGTDDDAVKDTLDGGVGGARCNYTAIDNTANCTTRI